MHTRIRHAAPEDLDALQALQWRSLRHVMGGRQPAALEAALWRVIGVTQRHLAAGACLLAEAGGCLQGLVAWHAEPLQQAGLARDPLPPLPEARGRIVALRALQVAPEAEGEGLGRALLNEAEQQVAAEAAMLEALVPPNAEAFFLRHGYVAVSTHATRLGAGKVLEMRRVVRALPPPDDAAPSLADLGMTARLPLGRG